MVTSRIQDKSREQAADRQASSRNRNAWDPQRLRQFHGDVENGNRCNQRVGEQSR
jgi:hypothetical protein